MTMIPVTQLEILKRLTPVVEELRGNSQVPILVSLGDMKCVYDWAWVEAQTALTMDVWNACAGCAVPQVRRYSDQEHRERERAYDEALDTVEREARRARGLKRGGAAGSDAIYERVVKSFARFAATALDLDGDSIDLLTQDFLPAGTQLARWARQFDPGLSKAGIIQACRNAWTACGLQPLLGQPAQLTPSILGYSLLYPYSDNHLDRDDVSRDGKLAFCRRFRERLRGVMAGAENEQEAAVWALVELVEGQYPRVQYPQVFDCLLAIHRAQEQSLAQVRGACSAEELLRISCAKGGTSVLADACLAQPWLSDAESGFAFGWGVVLQLGDDLQDVREDRQRGSLTLFSGAAARGERLDQLVRQLLNFSEQVATEAERLPHGTTTLKGLLRMSWRSLILMAVAESHAHFSRDFLAEAEGWSPFRFGFLRRRRDRLAGQQGLYKMLFDIFLEAGNGEDAGLPAPQGRRRLASEELEAEVLPA